MASYIFVVDTDTYAGNFERELTAYCTGVVGECGVGSDAAERFRAEHPARVEAFEALMAQVPDENGCHRPAAIYPTPGWFNDGLGHEYPDAKWGTAEVLERYRKEAAKHKLTGRKPGRHPAFMSVAMHMSERPSPEVVDFLIQRVRSYNKDVAAKKLGKFATGFKVTGYRLVQEKSMTKTIQTWSAVNAHKSQASRRHL